MKGKKGSYDAHLILLGIEDYAYTKEGKEIKGSQYKVKLPTEKPVNVAELTDTEFNAELEKGYDGRKNKTGKAGIFRYSQRLWNMMYKVTVSEQAEADLRGFKQFETTYKKLQISVGLYNFYTKEKNELFIPNLI